MAIQRGPYGTGFVKRLGNTVGYKKGGGEYGIMAYQPEVINPRTVAQRVQRTKFTFLRTIASSFGNDALRGLERQPYTGLQQAFMSINMPYVAVQVGSDYVDIDTRVTCESMKLSMGYETAPSANLNNLVRGDFRTELIVPKGATAYMPDGVILVIGVAKYIGEPGYNMQVFDYGYTAPSGNNYSTGTKHINIVTPGQNPETYNYDIFCWAYNYRFVGGVRRQGDISFDSELAGEGGMITGSSTSDIKGSRRVFSPTYFYGATNITQ